MLCAVAHDNLSSAIVQLVIGRELFGNCLTQFRNTSAGCVFCKSGFKRIDSGFFYVFGRVEIRFARAEAANVDAFSFHGFGFAIDRERKRWTELSGAFGNFHCSRASGEVVQSWSASYWRR